MPQDVFANDILSSEEALSLPVLVAYLEDGLGIFCGFVKFVSLTQFVGHTFFQIHVFAGLKGGNRNGGVPVVGGSDHDGFNIRVIQHGPVVAVCFGLMPVSGAGGDTRFSPHIENIADSSDAYIEVFLLKIILQPGVVRRRQGVIFDEFYPLWRGVPQGARQVLTPASKTDDANVYWGPGHGAGGWWRSGLNIEFLEYAVADALVMSALEAGAGKKYTEYRQSGQPLEDVPAGDAFFISIVLHFFCFLFKRQYWFPGFGAGQGFALPEQSLNQYA